MTVRLQMNGWRRDGRECRRRQQDQADDGDL
jgi:hypothetical protein